MQCPNCLGRGKRAVVVNGRETGEFLTCSRCNGTGNVGSIYSSPDPQGDMWSVRFNSAIRYYNEGKYDFSISSCQEAYKCTANNSEKVYNLLGCCYHAKGDEEKAISYLKKAVDNFSSDAKENLEKFYGIQYTRNSGSSSSSSSSSSSEEESPVVRFFQAIGFEDIDYFGYQINIPVSILLSLVITACITFLAYVFIPQKAVIVAVVSLVLSFLAFACTHKVLRVILIIIAAIGLALGVYTFVSPSKSATTQTQTATATINANVNFRKEPTTGDNIIRQLQQGDTVTLTGETNGSWTQIQHNGDTGWISTEYLNK
jgi:hypothetical protein